MSKILVVDDEVKACKLLKRFLEAKGYEVVTAGNGIEALAKLKSEFVDLVITDILMPKMDGFQLCRKCKTSSKLRMIPFIFYTASYISKKDKEFALSLGAEKFIVKPLDLDKLLKILEATLKESATTAPETLKTPIKEDKDYLVEYSKRLVEKLEKKVLDLEKEIKLRKMMEEDIINASLDVIISINEKEEIILWNDAATKTLGYTKDEALGKPITIIIPTKYHKKHTNGIKRFIKTGKAKLIGKVVEVDGIRKDGSMLPVELSLSDSKSKMGHIFTAIIRDISERRLFEKKLETMAIRDSLTGMYNRHYFKEVIYKEFERAGRYKHFISIMMIDVDKFKMINDNCGHAQGDRVLKGIARCLSENVRASDIVIRYGGDEFLVVLPETNSRDLKKITENVKRKVKDWGDNIDIGFPVSISIGGYTLNPDRKGDVDKVLKEADKRLYEDKRYRKAKALTPG